VDHSMEKDLSELLEKYQRDVLAERQLVEMSNVAYFASSSAKVLIGYAQEVEAKGKKLKVRSSMPVVQTLNLLGAKSWLDIEACTKPNAKPPKEARTSATGIAPASRPSTTGITPAKPGGNGAATATATAAAPAAATPAVAPRPSTTTMLSRPGSSGVRAAVSGQEQANETAAGAQDRAGALLVEDETELVEDYGVLRELIVLGMYCFHFKEGTELTGRVLDHISGPWILIDTRGAKRMINIAHVTAIDIL